MGAAQHSVSEDEGLRVLRRDPVANAEYLQRRMQEIVDGELAQERERQVDELVRKVSLLQGERQRARTEVEEAERKYEGEVQTLPEQLHRVHSDAVGEKKKKTRI